MYVKQCYGLGLGRGFNVLYADWKHDKKVNVMVTWVVFGIGTPSFHLLDDLGRWIMKKDVLTFIGDVIRFQVINIYVEHAVDITEYIDDVVEQVNVKTANALVNENEQADVNVEDVESDVNMEEVQHGMNVGAMEF